MAINTGRLAQMGGGITMYMYAYTHTDGEANETIGVGAGRVFAAILSSQDSGGAYTANPCRFTESISGNINTVTIHNSAPVTAGRLVFFVLSGQ